LRRPSISNALNRPPILTGTKVKLRPKRLRDAATDYSWRQDTELCRLDAATPILCTFEEYLRDYAEELQRPSQGYRFAIETLDGKHIGNCSYFNLDETKMGAEVGIMIGDRAYWNHGYGADAILTSLNYIFSQTNLKRIYLKTLNWNVRAQKCFRKCGFIPCGQLICGDHAFIIMEIHHPAKLQEQVKYQRK
jgi:RimJ/RimL family protein N-acetyltransferase